MAINLDPGRAFSMLVGLFLGVGLTLTLVILSVAGKDLREVWRASREQARRRKAARR